MKYKRVVGVVITALLCMQIISINAKAAFISEEEAPQEIEILLDEAKTELEVILEKTPIMGTVYLVDTIEVKDSLDQGAGNIVTVKSGDQVLIKGISVWENGIWLTIEVASQDNLYQGYIPFQNVAYSDEYFEQWVEKYVLQLEVYLNKQNVIVTRAGNTADIDQFPASYQSYLRSLKSIYPNWTFVKFQTNLQWGDVVAEQMKGNRSYVYTTAHNTWKGAATGEKNWFLATEGALKYVLDPRNALQEVNIFQFEQLTYNASYHTSDAVQHIVNGSFMDGGIPGTNMKYSKAFYDIGSSIGVSPYHLACRVYQEQGSEGKSPLISGTYAGYAGLYNYFNIGASGKNESEVIKNGLDRAQREGWTRRYASLEGGARIISKNYILKGQDTLYLQKFDVDSSYGGLYNHQYMQNIEAPTSEGKKVRSAYVKAGAINNKFVFKIPVYHNMPASASVDPSTGETNTGADMKQIKAFVERLYTKVLGRSAEEEGMKTWSSLLASGEMTGAQVSYGFIFSNEFLRKQLSYSDYVEVLYQTFMNRGSDPSGKKTWMDALDSGVGYAGVFKGFVESAEFDRICNSYGINAGSYTPEEARDVNANLTMFISRMYTKALGRTFDVAGLNNWCNWMLLKQQTAESTAAGFIFSEEMNNKNLSDEEFVKVLYRVFLNREYDAAGLSTWVNLLQSGTERKVVLQGFSNSLEFSELVKYYGL